ncbi:MAG: dethiobiotin synthase [Desulfobacteraceae bacterium]|jgi:dethiobiotin synthetase
MKDLPDIAVTGTDTGVGKSVAALLLMQLLFAKGYAPFYVKPFQTGCADPYDPDSDAAFVYGNTTALKNEDPAQSVLHCYPDPKAPYFAARDLGQSIDPETVIRRISQVRRTHAPIVVEAAGGLLVPVTDALLVVDILQTWDCETLLVARAGLGTINHTLLSIEALRQRGIDPIGVVLTDTIASPADPALVAENIEAIELFAGVQVGGVIPVIDDFSNVPDHAYQALVNILF